MIMNSNFLRAAGKRVLKHFPFAYEFAKRKYIRHKLSEDRRIFSANYPEAAYLLRSDEELRLLDESGYFSQFGQDQYILEKLFPEERSGFYVDIGCNEPKLLSNSYSLEQRGWQGIAIDPMKRVERMWKAERNADFRLAAVAENEEWRDFVEIQSHEGWEHTLSGFKGYVRREDMSLYGYQEYKVRTAPLSSFLPEGQTVDIIMIDVEGAEELVLRGADIAKVKPEYIMVENVGEIGGRESVRRLVLDAGYQLIARLGGSDDVFRRCG